MKKRSKGSLVNALDVAAYILTNRTNNQAISAWKMHKLVYYCQAFSLIRDEQALYTEKVLATKNGILIRELRVQHKGDLYVGSSTVGNVNHLSLMQVDTIDFVMEKYGEMSDEELEALVKTEKPWIVAREKSDKDSQEITIESMKEYYH